MHGGPLRPEAILVLCCFSAGAMLREVQLPAVLQPLQDHIGFLARSAEATDELPGMSTHTSLCLTCCH